MANFDPVYLSISDRPRAVLRVMDDLLHQRDTTKAQQQRRRWVPRLLFLAGFPLIAADLFMGYNCVTFTLAAIGLWLTAFYLWRTHRRASIRAVLPPHYQTARDVIATLRDDLDPKRDFFGHLDLTGAQLPTKLTREANNAAGLAVQFYRDEWLALKGKLYDGNMLRISAVEWNKVRKAYRKRSRVSGKSKLKPPKIQNGQQLTVKIAVNPEVYTVVIPSSVRSGAKVGQYTLSDAKNDGGILQVEAVTTAKTITPADVLSVLHLAYTWLRRKDSHESAVSSRP